MADETQVAQLTARLSEQEARIVQLEKQLQTNEARWKSVWKHVLNQETDMNRIIDSYNLTVTGLSQPLVVSKKGIYTTNGLTYINLPPCLLGLLTSCCINEGDFTFQNHSTLTATVYLLRKHDWEEVDLSGWTTVMTGSFFEFCSCITVYSKPFPPGEYTLSSANALYFFDLPSASL